MNIRRLQQQLQQHEYVPRLTPREAFDLDDGSPEAEACRTIARLMARGTAWAWHVRAWVVSKTAELTGVDERVIDADLLGGMIQRKQVLWSNAPDGKERVRIANGYVPEHILAQRERRIRRG